jgi:soluble lytic murein transglycosylase-like protein
MARRKKDPAALQMVNILQDAQVALLKLQQSFDVSFKNLTGLLDSSGLFGKTGATSILRFFKNAIPLLMKIETSTRQTVRGKKGFPGFAPVGTPFSQQPPPSSLPRIRFEPLTPEKIDKLIEVMRSVSLSSFDLSDDLQELLQKKLKVTPADIKTVEDDFEKMQQGLTNVLRKVVSVKKGSGSIAADFEVSSKNIGDLLEDFTDVIRSSHFAVGDFESINNKIKDTAFRMELTRWRMEQIEKSAEKAAKSYRGIAENLKVQVLNLLKLHGREFMLGSIEGIKSFIGKIAGLNDAIIELRKTAQFDLPPEQWRKDIIKTAEDFNKMAKPIYTLPTEIADAYIAVAKTGAKAEDIVKKLGETIYLMSKATNVSIDAAADLGHTMTTVWKLSADEASNFLASLVQTSRTVDIPIDTLIEGVRTLGDQFIRSFREGEVEGEARKDFLVSLANAIGSLNQVGGDSTKVLSSMALALQNTPEAATQLQAFGVSVDQIKDAITSGDMPKAFKLLLGNMGRLRSASETGGDVLRRFAELAQIDFETLQSTIQKAPKILKQFEAANTAGLKNWAKSTEALTNLAAEESSKLGNVFDNWLKKFWTNVEKKTEGSVSYLIKQFYKFKDAIIPAYFALKLFGLGFDPILKITGFAASALVKYGIAVLGAKLGTTLFSDALSATTFGGFLKGTAKAIGALLGIGTTAGTSSVSLGTLAWTMWSVVWPVLAVVAAITAVILVWKNWNKIIAWFQKTFPNWSKGVEVAMGAMRDEWKRDVEAFKDWWHGVKLAYSDTREMIKTVAREAKVFANWMSSKIDWWQQRSDKLRATFGIKTETREAYEQHLKEVQAQKKQREAEKQATLARALIIKKEAALKRMKHEAELDQIREKIRIQKAAFKTTMSAEAQNAKAIMYTTKVLLGASTGTAEFSKALTKNEQTFANWVKQIEEREIGIKGINQFASNIEQAIAKASKQYNVEPNLIRSVIMQESSGNPSLQSKAGARGLMQLMPSTASDLGLNTLEDIYDTNKNVMAGTKYLGQLLDRYGGDVNKALAAYNWGMGSLNKYFKGSKKVLPQETKDYIEKVNAYYAAYQRKYPPTVEVAMDIPMERTVTPEPTAKVPQPQPPVAIMPSKLIVQEEVVAAVKESTKATEKLTALVEKNAQKNQGTGMILPKPKKDELATLIAQYQI